MVVYTRGRGEEPVIPISSSSSDALSSMAFLSCRGKPHVCVLNSPSHSLSELLVGRPVFADMRPWEGCTT